MKFSKVIFSSNRKYRYVLQRIWNLNKPALMVIGLNPSTANEHKNDRTVTRCINYAKKWGFGSLYMMNLFAYRSTNYKNMINHHQPIGIYNNFWIDKVAKRSGLILCAWSNHGGYLDQDKKIKQTLKNRNLYCLNINNSGQPKHPLYCHGDLQPVLYI